jgi:hypothetical protein
MSLKPCRASIQRQFLRFLQRGRGARVVEKEAQHLTRGVGASRIGVGSRGAATRPRVAGSVDVPLLEGSPVLARRCGRSACKRVLLSKAMNLY